MLRAPAVLARLTRKIGTAASVRPTARASSTGWSRSTPPSCGRISTQPAARPGGGAERRCAHRGHRRTTRITASSRMIMRWGGPVAAGPPRRTWPATARDGRCRWSSPPGASTTRRCWSPCSAASSCSATAGPDDHPSARTGCWPTRATAPARTAACCTTEASHTPTPSTRTRRPTAPDAAAQAAGPSASTGRPTSTATLSDAALPAQAVARTGHADRQARPQLRSRAPARTHRHVDAQRIRAHALGERLPPKSLDLRAGHCVAADGPSPLTRT